MAIQVAGELYYDLDGQLVEIKRQLRQPSGYPFDLNQLKTALQNAIEGRFDGTDTARGERSLFSVIAATQLGAIDGKKTKKCFTGSRWAYRDSDIDNWIQRDQPNSDACVISTLAPARNWTFVEAAAAILGIGAGTDTVPLGKLLIEHCHTITLAQAEEMVEKTERGEEIGMRADGYGNFFFVETGSKDPVSVGDVRRDGRGWEARVARLGRDARWYADSRLLVRNLDSSKLCF